MAQRKLDKAINVLICACVIMIILLGVSGIVWFRRIEMPYTIDGYDKDKAITILSLEYSINAPVYSNRYYREHVEDDLNIHIYFCVESGLKQHNGLCFGNIRLIVIDEDVSGYQYCYTFAHEIMHLKHMIKQENYVCFETFKYLYESEEFHNVGVWYGLRQLNGCYSGEYNISNQIVDYLTNK